LLAIFTSNLQGYKRIPLHFKPIIYFLLLAVALFCVAVVGAVSVVNFFYD